MVHPDEREEDLVDLGGDRDRPSQVAVNPREEHVDRDPAERRGERASASRSSVLRADEGDDVVVAVMYDDKDASFAMVHDPQTDENFGKIMELLEGEPTWTDGEWLGPGA